MNSTIKSMTRTPETPFIKLLSTLYWPFNDNTPVCTNLRVKRRRRKIRASKKHIYLIFNAGSPLLIKLILPSSQRAGREASRRIKEAYVQSSEQ